MAMVESDYVRYRTGYWPSQLEWGRQEAQRLHQKEQQYMQQIARIQMEKQELYRRQMEAYQRLQTVSGPYNSSSTSNNSSSSYYPGMNSTWQQQQSTSSRGAQTSGQQTNAASSASYGPAPTVRKPSEGLKSLTKPLSVDCSVEYELPEFLKVTKGGPPLLMIQTSRGQKKVQQQQQRRPCPLGGCGKCGASKLAPSASFTSGQLEAQASMGLAEAGGNAKGGLVAMQQAVRRRPSHVKMEPAAEQIAKVSLKRKYMELESQEAEYKRQKMMSLTPPDIVSTSQYYLDSAAYMYRYPQQQREAMYGRVPPGPAAMFLEDQRFRPYGGQQQQQQMYQPRQMMPCACPGCRHHHGMALMAAQ